MPISEEKTKFESIVLELQLLDEVTLNNLKAESIKANKSIESLIRDRNLLSEEDLAKVKAVLLGVPYVDLRIRDVDVNILKYLDRDVALNLKAIPFGVSGAQLNVAMTDPGNVQTIDFIAKKTGFLVNSFMASLTSIQHVIDQYQSLAKEVTEVLKEFKITSAKKEVQESPEIKSLTADTPITRALSTILEYAVKSRASDVHIEPREQGIKVRYRIDGVLQDTMTLPLHTKEALISRVKILAHLKIDEHRIPQDGRFDISVEGKEIDIRVSITPITWGEKVVLRLLEKTAGVLTLEALGFRGRAATLINESIKIPRGMTLSTGPTGSGKSTTLYAILSKLNTVEVNIITLEDPVEYQIEGINQIQINPAVGLTFASGLRSILRQDPDIIMVGEIRDIETAQLAVQAALTGHIVLSTLHTNSASGVLPRLVNMQVEPYLIASTVNAVMGQRLARRICPDCKKTFLAPPDIKRMIQESLEGILPKKGDPDSIKKKEALGYQNLPFLDDHNFFLYKGMGCKKCRNLGYKGRVGLYEVFQITPEMGDLLSEETTTQEVEELAIKQGMITMKEDGLLKVLEGSTTIEEVLRVAADMD